MSDPNLRANAAGVLCDKISSGILAKYEQADPPVKVITAGVAWGKSEFQAVPPVTVGPTATPMRGVMSRPDQVPGLPTVSRRGNERNKPCICGSGKKAKKCCLLKMEMQLQETVKASQEARMLQMQRAMAKFWNSGLGKSIDGAIEKREIREYAAEVQAQIAGALKAGSTAVVSADGSSVTAWPDVTSALESAQAGSKVFIPQGIHKLSQPIQMPADISIIGQGREATTVSAPTEAA